jgi:hypothetical protein
MLAKHLILWFEQHQWSIFALLYLVLRVLILIGNKNKIVVDLLLLSWLHLLLIVILLSLGWCLIMISDIAIDLLYVDLVLVVFRSFPVVLCHFLSVFALLQRMIESTDLRLIAP